VPAVKLVRIPHYFENNYCSKDIVKRSSKKYILYLGRYSPNKRLDLLIRAFCHIRELDYDLILTISSEDLPKDLNGIVKGNSRIKLVGYVEDLEKKELLANCEALILPSDYEAFGIVCFEASFFAKTILCSNLRILKEVLDENGVIYFQNNIDSIKDALLYFSKLSDKELEQKGLVNKANILKYSFNTVVELYKSILN
jgi:glycosyltransferase involved in cell wall biosynthesis